MKNNHRVSAFSLIEISVVILIIGILIAGVTQASRLLTQAKLSSAKTMTNSAPVSSIRNLSLWVESTSDSSFQDSDLGDGTSITTWKDLNPQTVSKADFTPSSATGILLKTNIINGLPAVLVNADTSTTYSLSSANFSNISTASTVFAVVKLPSTLATETIFSKRTVGSAYTTASTVNLQLSTSAISTTGWTYCDGNTQITSASTCNFEAATTPTAASQSYVVSLVYNHGSDGNGGNTSQGLTFFQNGYFSGQVDTLNDGVAPVAVTSPLLVGRPSASAVSATDYFHGYIGEIIIFDRALKKEERQSIEAYLGKKWGIAMTVASY